MVDKTIFKAYDIRGLVDGQVTPQIAYLIGKAYGRVIAPKSGTICLGRDVRLTGPDLMVALAQGLIEEGLKVISIGTISTEMLYFATAKYGYDGGLSVTASHNPPEYNGFKLVRAGAVPIAKETGIDLIEVEVLNLELSGVNYQKNINLEDLESNSKVLDDYVDYLMSLVDLNVLKSMTPLTVAMNPNHGYSGVVIQRIIEKYQLPIKPVWLYKEPDGSFPQGRPDPMYTANQEAFEQVIKLNPEVKFGVAWDADADRCFFFGHSGRFINSYYVVGILAKIILEKYPNTKIVHDPRLIWSVISEVKKNGGVPLVERVGHSYIKARMRKEDAVFGGEVSGHYYFKDFWYADSGMLPFLYILELLVRDNLNLEDLAVKLESDFPTTGELNFTVENPDRVFEEVKIKYADAKFEFVDGISVEYPDWRFNIRKSNTEPLVRLNLEVKDIKDLQLRKTEVEELILGS